MFEAYLSVGGVSLKKKVLVFSVGGGNAERGLVVPPRGVHVQPVDELIRAVGQRRKHIAPQDETGRFGLRPPCGRLRRRLQGGRAAPG